MEEKLKSNSETKEKELSNLIKAKAVAMRLEGSSPLQIAIILKCDIDAMEEYLNGLKLTEETMKLLYNRKISNKQISQECVIPINIVDSWRNIIGIKRQRRRAKHKMEVQEKLAAIETSKMTRHKERAALLEAVKVEPKQLSTGEKQKLDLQGKKLLTLDTSEGQER